MVEGFRPMKEAQALGSLRGAFGGKQDSDISIREKQNCPAKNNENEMVLMVFME